ncbi:MAG: acetyl-CoA C-acetyltransferase [Vicinamibacterales bacterium]|jgi:acetyl-CoA C-acetyltransferase|nr:acetyl-CoA C-acyltransferase [Acidobacteriota bacterium]MDP7472088.1 acetyl-CoA C-acetyltransferase [Vicinamibacterales bacterium]MDP7671828.1 acetyl-CoA C-acetyltransferase [Vicinamibacterales bacterium]HJO38656.1 acetyl-CoA C-acetyltransferase [Vicinamibacterales bacterium]|tara:strand:+ start:1767 stop:2972 length:1206 start_codon:yes stop_codon:yes gene_type:complete
MPVDDVVILGAARTPIGKYGGGLRDVHPAELGAVAAKAALTRAGIDVASVDDVWFGHARQAGSGPNPARQVGHRVGLPHSVPAQTINKACASGLQAIASGAQAIALGEADVVLAGGVESMSRMPYLVDAKDARWGHRLGNVEFVDAMYRDGFSCPLSDLIMGETAEILAHQYGISRDESDGYALESQARAEAAIAGGRFDAEIAPVEVASRKGRVTTIARDEHPRAGTTLELLQKLTPVFGEVEGHAGIITAGSASGITDGGAALVLASASRAAQLGCRPLATITGWASAGVDPRIMGIGPVPAIQKLLARFQRSVDDFDLVELNEAFAVQVLAVLRDVPIARDRLNVNGGAIALGHPIGCTGARIIVTLLHELARRDAARGLATLCVSGGMGMAMALERA